MEEFLIRIFCTLVAAVLLIHVYVKMKMSFIRKQDVGKRWKALNCLVYEVKPLTGILGL